MDFIELTLLLALLISIVRFHLYLNKISKILAKKGLN